jgi:Fe2+ or Zn2+ uptake regulation protein
MKDLQPTIFKKLKERGRKLTSQRLAIIEVLIENTSLHPDARFIYQEAKRKVKGLSLSTVYYTLSELSKLGIIKMLEFDKMGNRYETNIAEHINLICKGCKKIMDYMPSFVIHTNEIARKCGFRVTDSRLEYYGYCQECRKKGASHAA